MRQSFSTSRAAIILATILAPFFWGTTYVVFTETLPVDHPLLVAALRAIPAGLILLAFSPGLPSKATLLPLFVVGLTNISIFFGLLFISASRLPGGVAATLMSAQPLLVGLLAWPLLSRRPSLGHLVAALTGILGVGLLIFDPSQSMDWIGVGAALVAAASMAVGTILIERWGRLGTPVTIAAWQLTLGGLVLLPVAFVVEGVPSMISGTNALGLAYLVVPGTALTYWVWTRGITLLGANVTFLNLLTPLVAATLGAIWLGEWFAPLQLLGAATILASAAAGMVLSRRGQVTSSLTKRQIA